MLVHKDDSQKAALLPGLGLGLNGFHESSPKLSLPAYCVAGPNAHVLGGASGLSQLQQICSSPRNECRSAVRIKVLDVLSFVLLINRQFYEVSIQS